mmetsp:Transcript_72853/g.161130  ORF Transcript_72853/g.161130 Transcript_72853/m.161130 type:complete len:313 (-) Transcript_72853:1149-2087(-)
MSRSPSEPGVAEGDHLRELALGLATTQVLVDVPERIGHIQCIGFCAADHLDVDAIADRECFRGHGHQVEHAVAHPDPEAEDDGQRQQRRMLRRAEETLEGFLLVQLFHLVVAPMPRLAVQEEGPEECRQANAEVEKDIDPPRELGQVGDLTPAPVEQALNTAGGMHVLVALQRQHHPDAVFEEAQEVQVELDERPEKPVGDPVLLVQRVLQIRPVRHEEADGEAQSPAWKGRQRCEGYAAKVVSEEGVERIPERRVRELVPPDILTCSIPRLQGEVIVAQDLRRNVLVTEGQELQDPERAEGVKEDSSHEVW